MGKRGVAAVIAITLLLTGCASGLELKPPREEQKKSIIISAGRCSYFGVLSGDSRSNE